MKHAGEHAGRGTDCVIGASERAVIFDNISLQIQTSPTSIRETPFTINSTIQYIYFFCVLERAFDCTLYSLIEYNHLD